MIFSSQIFAATRADATPPQLNADITMHRSLRLDRYKRGVVSVAFSRGLLSSGEGGGGGGEEDANATNTTTTKLRPLPPGLDAIECKLERIVKDSLSSFVSSRITLMHDTGHREVVQANGPVMRSANNCTVLALLDAGVAMRGVLVATTCVVFNNGDRRTR
jgi:hypothetical protein